MASDNDSEGEPNGVGGGLAKQGLPADVTAASLLLAETSKGLLGDGAATGVRLDDVYEVQKPIGKGKFSTVYKGVRRSDGTPVALKKIAIADMSPAQLDKCLKEIRLVQSLDHDNIIRYLNGFIEDKQLILVFEFAGACAARRRDTALTEVPPLLQKLAT
jgi:serine/threonine protein kinase